MTEIDIKQDCGNSPKQKLIADINVALAKSDIKFILENTEDNIKVNLVGNKIIEGKAELETWVKNTFLNNVKKLELQNVVNHGNNAAANGILEFNNGKIIAFCSIYKFKGFTKTAKIESIAIYNVNLEDKN